MEKRGLCPARQRGMEKRDMKKRGLRPAHRIGKKTNANPINQNLDLHGFGHTAYDSHLLAVQRHQPLAGLP